MTPTRPGTGSPERSRRAAAPDAAATTATLAARRHRGDPDVRRPSTTPSSRATCAPPSRSPSSASSTWSAPTSPRCRRASARSSSRSARPRHVRIAGPSRCWPRCGRRRGLLLRIASESLAREWARSTPRRSSTSSDAISAYVDELAAASTDGFTLQLREQAGEGDRRRRRLAELLLRGSAPPSVVAAAACGIGLGGRSMSWCPCSCRPTRRAMPASATAPTVWSSNAERDAVLLLRGGPRAHATAAARGARGRGAVVGPALGWAQVPEAVRLAELMRDDVAGPDPGPVFADDHLAAAGGARRARRAGRAVGAGASPRWPACARAQRESLLVTLHSWLRHWGSRAESPRSCSCTRRRSATASTGCASCSATTSTIPTPASNCSWCWPARHDRASDRVRSDRARGR